MYKMNYRTDIVNFLEGALISKILYFGEVLIRSFTVVYSPYTGFPVIGKSTLNNVICIIICMCMLYVNSYPKSHLTN